MQSAMKRLRDCSRSRAAAGALLARKRGGSTGTAIAEAGRC